MNKNIWSLPKEERTKLLNAIAKCKLNIEERNEKIKMLTEWLDKLKRLNVEDDKTLKSIIDTYSDAEK